MDKTNFYQTLLFPLDGQFALHSVILVYFIEQIVVKHWKLNNTIAKFSVIIPRKLQY